MRTLATTLAMLVLTAAPVLADGPIGEWLTEKGDARIRIENCGDRLWGVVTWEKEPGIDSKNPDPAKRGRPTLGVPIILGMSVAGEGRWKGGIYNAENGKTYAAEIKLQKADALRVQGCVMAILCGGETWTRVSSSADDVTMPPGKGNSRNASKSSGKTKSPANSKSKNAAKPAVYSAKEFCEALPEAARASHQGGLK